MWGLRLAPCGVKFSRTVFPDAHPSSLLLPVVGDVLLPVLMAKDTAGSTIPRFMSHEMVSLWGVAMHLRAILRAIFTSPPPPPARLPNNSYRGPAETSRQPVCPPRRDRSSRRHQSFVATANDPSHTRYLLGKANHEPKCRQRPDGRAKDRYVERAPEKGFAATFRWVSRSSSRPVFGAKMEKCYSKMIDRCCGCK